MPACGAQHEALSCRRQRREACSPPKCARSHTHLLFASDQGGFTPIHVCHSNRNGPRQRQCSCPAAHGRTRSREEQHTRRSADRRSSSVLCVSFQERPARHLGHAGERAASATSAGNGQGTQWGEAQGGRARVRAQCCSALHRARPAEARLSPARRPARPKSANQPPPPAAAVASGRSVEESSKTEGG